MSKNIYFLTINNNDGFFQFHVWGNSSKEAKRLTMEVYNNSDYEDNLPEDRKNITEEVIEIRKVYNKETKSHVMSADWSPSINNVKKNKNKRINNLLDGVIKVIDEFEKGDIYE